MAKDEGGVYLHLPRIVLVGALHVPFTMEVDVDIDMQISMTGSINVLI